MTDRSTRSTVDDHAPATHLFRSLSARSARRTAAAGLMTPPRAEMASISRFHSDEDDDVAS